MLKCDECSANYEMWLAENSFWEAIMECEPGAGGQVCMACFQKKCKARGLSRSHPRIEWPGFYYALPSRHRKDEQDLFYSRPGEQHYI